MRVLSPLAVAASLLAVLDRTTAISLSELLNPSATSSLAPLDTTVPRLEAREITPRCYQWMYCTQLCDMGVMSCLWWGCLSNGHMRRDVCVRCSNNGSFGPCPEYWQVGADTDQEKPGWQEDTDSDEHWGGNG